MAFGGKHLCWFCKEEAGVGHFCEHCVKLQPLSRVEDYFAFMGLERRMGLDPKKLEGLFYSLSRKFHPDFYQDSSPTEKALSLERTAVLNNAFQVLKDPIQRAEYLLDLECPAPAKERAKTSTALIQEVFEIQEVVDSYRRSGGDAERAASLKKDVERASQEVLEKIRVREETFQEACLEWDRLISHPPSSPEALKEAKWKQAQTLRAILDEMAYLKTLFQMIQGKPISH